MFCSEKLDTSLGKIAELALYKAYLQQFVLPESVVKNNAKTDPFYEQTFGLQIWDLEKVGK